MFQNPVNLKDGMLERRSIQKPKVTEENLDSSDILPEVSKETNQQDAIKQP